MAAKPTMIWLKKAALSGKYSRLSQELNLVQTDPVLLQTDPLLPQNEPKIVQNIGNIWTYCECPKKNNLKKTK